MDVTEVESGEPTKVEPSITVHVEASPLMMLVKTVKAPEVVSERVGG